MLSIIVNVLLIIVLIIQIVSLSYMLIHTIKRNKEDKIFWESVRNDIEESSRKCLALTEKTYNSTHRNEQDEKEENKNGNR